MICWLVNQPVMGKSVLGNTCRHYVMGKPYSGGVTMKHLLLCSLMILSVPSLWIGTPRYANPPQTEREEAWGILLWEERLSQAPGEETERNQESSHWLHCPVLPNEWVAFFLLSSPHWLWPGRYTTPMQTLAHRKLPDAFLLTVDCRRASAVGRAPASRRAA